MGTDKRFPWQPARCDHLTFGELQEIQNEKNKLCLFWGGGVKKGVELVKLTLELVDPVTISHTSMVLRSQ
jgi:hypothetical protein